MSRMELYEQFIRVHHMAECRWRRRHDRLGADHPLTRQANRLLWFLWWNLVGGEWSATRASRYGIEAVRRVRVDGSIRIAKRRWRPTDRKTFLNRFGWAWVWVPRGSRHAYRLDDPGPSFEVEP
jgi:hypothetical protein